MSGHTQTSVLVAVLLAAALHATWNALAHAVHDRLVMFALISSVALVGGAVLIVSSAPPARASWAFVGVSAALHVSYLLLLMRSYRLGDFSQVYPLARGSAVAFVALAATLALAEPMPARRLAGVSLVCAGLGVLTLSRGLPRRGEGPALAAALATGVLIAGYTVVDGLGVRRAGSVPGYTGWLFLLQGPAVPLLAVAVRRRALGGHARRYLGIGLVGGVLSLLAYGLVLWAQTRGALSVVAALRETSILIGAVVGAVLFREPFGRSRVVAAALVTAGVILANA